MGLTYLLIERYSRLGFPCFSGVAVFQVQDFHLMSEWSIQSGLQNIFEGVINVCLSAKHKLHLLVD